MKSGLTQGFAFSPQSRGGGQCVDPRACAEEADHGREVRREHYPLGPLDSRASGTTTRSRWLTWNESPQLSVPVSSPVKCGLRYLPLRVVVTIREHTRVLRGSKSELTRRLSLLSSPISLLLQSVFWGSSRGTVHTRCGPVSFGWEGLPLGSVFLRWGIGREQDW